MIKQSKKEIRVMGKNKLFICENPKKHLKNVLVVQTGGTIACEETEAGLSPSDKQYLDLVPEVFDLANLDIIKTANIDSTDMGTKEREMVAELIYKYSMSNKYDGYVVIHGTDTMVDTACTLNYMIQNMGKPIALTGAQKSMFEDPVSDGRRNIYYAIKTATANIGEICIVFGDAVLRGCRSFKESEQDLNAFTSPRAQPLGSIGLSLLLNKDVIVPRKNGEPVLFTKFSTKVAIYDQASGADTNLFNLFVESDEVEGIIIRGYGAGNIQSKLVPHIQKCTERGKPVLVVTTCSLGGADMGDYSVGAAPLRAGAISGGDLTFECSLQKLMYALGKAKEHSFDTNKQKLDYIKSIISRNYNGDITENFEKRFEQQ